MTEAEAILIIGISALALWKKGSYSPLLYMGAFISFLLYGFHFAETSWMLATPVLALAGVMIWQFVAYWWR